MIQYIIPLVAAVVGSPLCIDVIIYLTALMFVATAPCIIRQFITLWGH